MDGGLIMSEPKFTQGPWEIKPVENDKEYIRIRGTVPGGRYKIVNVSDLKFHHDDGAEWCEQEREASRANAHLIATSPDLYAEIERDVMELEARLKFADERTLAANPDVTNLKRKKALLAKARGEHI